MVKSITESEVMLVWETYVANGRNGYETARSMGVSQGWLNRRLEKARKFFEDTKDTEEQFYIDKSALPDEVADLDEIIEKRRREFRRRDNSEKARNLIVCEVKADGPIGVLHFGDPHVDDPGTSIDLLEPKMFGIIIVDLIGGHPDSMRNKTAVRLLDNLISTYMTMTTDNDMVINTHLSRLGRAMCGVPL